MLGTELGIYKYWINYSLHQHHNIGILICQKQKQFIRLKKLSKFFPLNLLYLLTLNQDFFLVTSVRKLEIILNYLLFFIPYVQPFNTFCLLICCLL